MKVNNNGEEITIYLNNYYTKEINFLDLDTLEDYMNNLFKILKETYNLNIKGYYNIDVYIDEYYGCIIDMKHEDIEYYEYFADQVDTQVTIHNNVNFLYKIDDFFEIRDYLIDTNYSLYKYNDELYIKLNSKLENIKLANILEYCNEICYDIKEIIKTNNLLFYNK